MMRAFYVATTLLAVATLCGASVADGPPKLVWNASASAPIGLYAIRPAAQIKIADLVAVRAPEPLAGFLDERGYLPRGAPLLKRVLGLPGQQVCRIGHAITVDGMEMGLALARDRIGRDLPLWQGCRRIRTGEVFLMNWQVRDSLDGRYFGPIPAAAIIGRAVLLWTRQDRSRRFEWGAKPTQLSTHPQTKGVYHDANR
jgi:conjugative transfer signal peptidase TraF